MMRRTAVSSHAGERHEIARPQSDGRGQRDSTSIPSLTRRVTTAPAAGRADPSRRGTARGAGPSRRRAAEFAAERDLLADLLPLVHIDFALSEIDHYQGAFGARAQADHAWEGFLLGHAAWFGTAPGQALLAALRQSD